MEKNVNTTQQLKRIRTGKGFIAALDQSGGSTPKALQLYGISEDQYRDEEEMFKLIHDMRTRIITSPSFSQNHIIGAILFEQYGFSTLYFTTGFMVSLAIASMSGSPSQRSA